MNEKGLNDFYLIESKGIYKYRTDIQRYDHKDETMQFIPNFIQVNRRDIRLPDTDLVNLESDLWGISRNLSKVPESRYLGPNSCSKKYNDKGLCVCPSCMKSNVVNQNSKESSQKIIKNRKKVDYSECNNKRTKTNNSNCVNKVTDTKQYQEGPNEVNKGFFSRLFG
jgi:hypothetical protein